MANLSQQRREKMLAFLETLKEQHSDDDSLIAIGEIEKELKAKKYGLVWEEHEEAVDVQMKTQIPVFTEVKEREISADEDGAYNFLLEGDNLHSLYLLEKTHKSSIDVIYIDPPYNTGKKDDFRYNDAFVVKEDTFRHSKWLSFMAERLKIAKKLLAKQGIIFISIDDNEHAALKLLCDEILGESNYITSLIWQKKKGGSNDSRHVATEHEYILVYANDVEVLNNIFIEYAEDYVSRYKEKDEIGRYFWDTFKRKSGKQYYPITCPDGTVLQYEENGEPISWLRSEARFLSDLETGETRIMKVNGKWTVHFKQRQPNGYKPRSIVTEYGTTSTGADQLKKIFNITNKFSNPKPTTLIEFLIKFSPNKNATILDFFAGSGTTGQAVLELNRQDGGNRRFILCTNNENGICENVTYERIFRVINGYSYRGKVEDAIFEKKIQIKDLEEPERMKQIIEKIDEITLENTTRYQKLKKQFKDGTISVIGFSQITDSMPGIPANLKYFKTDFVDKESEELVDELLEHIAEMIELEHGIKVDNQKYVMIMTDEEMDEFEKNVADYTELKAVFVSQDILLSARQQKLLDGLTSYVIPDYYFDFELREAGELW
ncbi:MAG: site-specific DNA-methyltransferase [Ruminococcus sp.]|nr:site-specific DNA-methyltransferase [Ruminococcus sp.]